MMDTDSLDRLLGLTKPPGQREAIHALMDKGTYEKASNSLGVSESIIRKRIDRAKAQAAKRGWSPEHDMTHLVPDGFSVKGTSTLYDDQGGQKLQWVKTNQDRERQAEIMAEAVEAMGESLPREKAVKPPTKSNSDLLSCYVLTDYHLGMLSWHEETGEDWDMRLAEDMLYKWFALAIKSAPNAETAVFAQLGDALHWDGLDAVTPAHHHVLDADTRFQKLVRVAIRAFRRIVRELLKKHKYVHLIMAEGNHDPASSIWLREWMSAIYEDEPRVTVDTNADPYYCVEHGDTSLFFHHGHIKKPSNIDSVFAGKFRDVFGRTTHSYAHLGHRHNQQVTETNLMIVKKHPTLATKDAYASRSGYLSQRAASVITYDKSAGCVGRSTITPEML